jgi:hypothetical protein
VIFLVTYITEAIAASSLLAFPSRNVSTWRAIRVVVIDPLLYGLQYFVDGIERVNW